MRSLIKMDISRYPVFDVVPPSELPYKDEVFKRNGAATHQSSRNNRLNNAIYCKQPNQTLNSKNCDNIEQITSRSQSLSKKPNRIKSIQKYISELTNDIENPKDEPDLGETKFKVLKRIIEHYDIKNMEKNEYSKLIKTFGLNIETAKTSEKKAETKSTNKNFTIKPTTTRGGSRMSSNPHRILKIDDDNKEVAFLELSKELKPIVMTEKPFTSSIKFRDETSQHSKQKCELLNLRCKSKSNKSKGKSMKKNPFKFQSNQDVVVEKVNKYREFLFSLNYSNFMYRKMDISKYEMPLKFYVGQGNNSNLIKSLLKKRFYFEQTNKIKEANFIWTQIKNQSVFEQQRSFDATGRIQIDRKTAFIEKQRRSLFSRSVQLGSPQQENYLKILCKKQVTDLMRVNEDIMRRFPNLTFEERIKFYSRRLEYRQLEESDRVHNHLPSNGLLGNKKGMFYCLREYYKITDRNVWQILPLTFHISKGVADNQYKQFLIHFQQRKKNRLQNAWIMKPGQFSNRGNGISCSNKFQEIKKRVMKCHVGRNGDGKTLILQLYITNPLLYNNRKFDIRVYMLITCHNGKIKAYWYQEGYIRTSSFAFDLGELGDNDIHLTNDAIQKQNDKYGKFEPGNKLSFAEMQRYLDTLPALGRNLDIYSTLIPKMKQIAAESLMSSFLFLDEHKRQNNFEIFGMDFMVDWNFKPWLIQINTNPCLELSCPLLERIIPNMVENAFRIGLDTIFPPPENVPHNYKFNIAEKASHYNKFELIFDEDRDGPPVRSAYEAHPASSSLLSSLMSIQEDQEVFEQQGILCDYDI